MKETPINNKIQLTVTNVLCYPT